MEIKTNGDIALKISFQLYDFFKEKSSLVKATLSNESSFIFFANIKEQKLIRVINLRIPFSSNENEILKIFIAYIQSRPLIIIPATIVANDQVAALSDIASLLLLEVVFRIINGSEQTRMNIIPNPHKKNANFIKGII